MPFDPQCTPPVAALHPTILSGPLRGRFVSIAPPTEVSIGQGVDVIRIEEESKHAEIFGVQLHLQRETVGGFNRYRPFARCVWGTEGGRQSADVDIGPRGTSFTLIGSSCLVTIFNPRFIAPPGFINTLNLSGSVCVGSPVRGDLKPRRTFYFDEVVPTILPMVPGAVFFAVIPSYAQSFKVNRFPAAQPIDVRQIDAASTFDQILVAAGATMEEMAPIVGGADLIRIENTGAGNITDISVTFGLTL